MGNIAAWCLHGKNVDTELEEMESNEKQLYVGNVWPGVETRITDNGDVVMKTPWQAEGYVKHACCSTLMSRITRLILVQSRKTNIKFTVYDSRDVSVPKVEIEWRGQRTTFSPNKIEAVLIAHPSVSDVLVLIQSKANREKSIVRARVVLNDGATVDVSELQQWCIEHNLSGLRDALVVK